MSGPARANDSRQLFRLHPDDEAEYRAALADGSADRFVELTPAELEQWQATGELPAEVEARYAALGCGDRS